MDIKIDDRYDMYNLMRMTVIVMVLTGSITLLNFTGNGNSSDSSIKGSALHFMPFTKQKEDNSVRSKQAGQESLNLQKSGPTERINPDRLF